MKSLKTIVRCIDTLNGIIGPIVGITLIIPLILATVYDVLLRYFFNLATIWAYELTWMLYAAFFLLGSGYTLLKDGHVKVDVFFNQLSKKNQALVDALFLLFFVLPLIVVIIRFSIPWAWTALITRERALISLWRPYTFPIKAVLPISFVLLGLQALSNFIKKVYFFQRGEDL